MTIQSYDAEPYRQTIDARITSHSGHQIELDRTVFYATGGGQPGDTGSLTTDTGQIFSVVNTIHGATGILHELDADKHNLTIGDSVLVEINWERRYRLMKMHTSLHLLCSLIPVPVTGGAVGELKSRLDFDLGEHRIDKDDLTTRLNKLVAAALPVEIEEITDADLEANPDLVRTMSVQPPKGTGRIRMIRIMDTDFQPCGGTHVRNTSEIGRLRVSKIENKGRRNRRVSLVLDAERESPGQ